MTTVGLLLCDHLDPDVAEVVGDYTELFPAAFGPVGIDLQVYDVTRDELPTSPDEQAGWIISGSRRSCYEDEGWIRSLEAFVRSAETDGAPLVGICFGHQLIAQALGGRVERADVGWGLGVRSFDIVDRPEWVTPEADSFRLLMSHRDQVVDLPSAATTVATASYCPVGAYRIEDRVFCVQGHPEFTPQLSRILMEKRRDALGDAVVAGLASLDQPADSGAVLEWSAAFLRGRSV